MIESIPETSQGTYSLKDVPGILAAWDLGHLAAVF